jgi:serine/threonine protein kinase
MYPNQPPLPRFHVHQNIAEGGYGKIYECIDLHHPEAAPALAALLAGQYPLPPVPREARVAKKALREPNTKWIIREVSVLQRIRDAQDARVRAEQAGDRIATEALAGSRHFPRLLHVEGRESGFPNIYMELCDTSLRLFAGLFKDRCIPLCCVHTFTMQMLSALDVLHNSVGAVHRDLKPDNILLAVVPIDAQGDSAESAWLTHGTPSPMTMRGEASHSALASPHHNEPATAPRPTEPEMPATAGKASHHGPLCPFCGSHLAPGEADPLDGFSGIRRDTGHGVPNARQRQHCALPDTIGDSFLGPLFQANGVEYTAGRWVCNMAPGQPLKGRKRLELRLCDFGSACFIGPQPVTPGHHFPATANDFIDTPFLATYPSCGEVKPVDPGERPHAMAMSLGRDAANSAQVPTLDPEPVDGLHPLKRPYVTHGWTTIFYRAPEDLLSASGNGGVPYTYVQEHKARIGTSIDMWAAGAILGELLSGEIIFWEATYSEIHHDEQENPWVQMVGVFNTIGAPECGPHRRNCHSHNSHEDCCVSPQCWPGVTSIVGTHSFVVATRTAQGICQRDVTADVDQATGCLACLPRFRSKMHDKAHGKLAKRCTLMDMLRVEPSRDTYVTDAEFDSVADLISKGITANVSPTYDLLMRLLMLDPTRRVCATEALEHPVMSKASELYELTAYAAALPPSDECRVLFPAPLDSRSHAAA